MGILKKIADILHRDCDGNIAFYQGKVEMLRQENRRLKERAERLEGSVAPLKRELAVARLRLGLGCADAKAFEAWGVEESEKRHQLVACFVQLARSRNRYRRKYAILHRLIKAYRFQLGCDHRSKLRP